MLGKRGRMQLVRVQPDILVNIDNIAYPLRI
jgi:hypothetical protein